MHLRTYISDCRELVWEILESVTDKDREFAMLFHEKYGENGVLDFLSEHVDSVAAFLAATPAKRDKLKVWNSEPEVKSILLYASFVSLQIAARMLDEANKMPPGLSKRNAAASAVESFLNIRKSIDFLSFDKKKFSF